VFDIDGYFKRRLSALGDADPTYCRRAGQQIEGDVVNRQPGMHASIILGDAHTKAWRYQSVLSGKQDGSHCDDHRRENQKRGGHPPQESHRSAYPQDSYSSAGLPAL
jgi:hypothetical protein